MAYASKSFVLKTILGLTILLVGLNSQHQAQTRPQPPLPERAEGWTNDPLPLIWQSSLNKPFYCLDKPGHRMGIPTPAILTENSGKIQ